MSRPRHRGVPIPPPTSAAELRNRARGMACLLRGARLDRDIGLRELGAALDVSPSVISDWERSAAMPTIANFCRWVRAVGMDPARTLEIIAIEAP
ncbi:MAG: helix-turn-helix transcriptional regulator [Proteobacteria bacterium]|nr:helix-turn-helix transcriptional regulator [Pseudomonadota bacterium]